MKAFLSLLLTILCTAVVPTKAIAQCGGNGPATFEFVSKNNLPIVAGSDVILRLRGEPNTYFCLICDLGRGPVDVPTLGTFCLDLAPGFVEFVAQIPASGVLDIEFKVPVGITERQLVCCQWFGLEPTNLTLSLSNSACVCLNEVKCEDGVNDLAWSACVDIPTSFPVTVKSTISGKLGGEVSTNYDPKSPPKFPVVNGTAQIEKISIVGGKLCVISRVKTGFDKDNKPLKLESNTTFTVEVGTTRLAQEIHTSCSKPIGTGMRFGDFTIVDMTSVAGCYPPCEGGVNELGLQTLVDAPTSYPITITAAAGKKLTELFYKTSFSYDPANPPSFPVTDDGHAFVDSITVVGNKLDVRMSFKAGINSKNERLKFPENDTLFLFEAGRASGSAVIHLSCSKPIGKGLEFGPFKVTYFVSVK